MSTKRELTEEEALQRAVKFSEQYVQPLLSLNAAERRSR